MTTPKPTPPEVMWTFIDYWPASQRWRLFNGFVERAVAESQAAWEARNLKHPTQVAAVIPAERYDELLARSERLYLYEPKPGHCEHGVIEGDWCQECNAESKLCRFMNEEITS
jgi:hypothetical protein